MKTQMLKIQGGIRFRGSQKLTSSVTALQLSNFLLYLDKKNLFGYTVVQNVPLFIQFLELQLSIDYFLFSANSTTFEDNTEMDEVQLQFLFSCLFRKPQFKTFQLIYFNT